MIKAILFIFQSQVIMFYNTLFQIFFGKTDVQNMFKKLSDMRETKYSGELHKINPDADVYLFNHVSSADCYIDNYIIGGTGCYISRLLVFFLLPFTCVYGMFNNIIYFFKRNGRDNKCKLKIACENIKYKLNKKIILYPEGTRNSTNNIIPLKRGGLYIIYNMGYSVQIINVKNKEKVINEKKMQLQNNVVCDIIASDIIHASDYNNFDDFYADVCKKWEECFYTPSGSSTQVEISTKENIQGCSQIYFVGAISILSVVSYMNLNLFIGLVHVLYAGMIIVSKHISTLKKEHIQSFIFYYNWFQVLLSLYMSVYGLTIFNMDNPLLLNNFDENIYIKNFILLHAFSKVVDFMDTAILITSGKPLSILHTYHHSSIGLIWFYLYNENINSAYFGAMLNSIVHTIMYFYFNYSDKLKSIKSWITRIQLTQFIVLIIHPIIFIYNTENKWYNKLALCQIAYQMSMIVLFCNFYYKNYISAKLTTK